MQQRRKRKRLRRKRLQQQAHTAHNGQRLIALHRQASRLQSRLDRATEAFKNGMGLDKATGEFRPLCGDDGRDLSRPEARKMRMDLYHMRRRMRLAKQRLEQRICNLVTDAQFRFAHKLCASHHLVLQPKFRVSGIVTRVDPRTGERRKFVLPRETKKLAHMLRLSSWSDVLTHVSRKYPWCTVVTAFNEARTPPLSLSFSLSWATLYSLHSPPRACRRTPARPATATAR